MVMHALPSIEPLQQDYVALQARGLKLDLTRGKPSAAQCDLSNELLALPGAGRFLAEGAVDIRNYGGLQGLVEVRRLFSRMMGAAPEKIVIAGNSSLALMHDAVVYALLHGTCDSPQPWAKEDIAFLCPVPGYDRHFTICEAHGIRMIPVPLRYDGPDMDAVEKLVAADASIKGMWCMPKYSNPTGTVYSAEVIERLARMPAAAPDFRLFWDNAYAVHHLTEERIEIANILDLAAAHGHPNRPLVFASTSKITLPGSGLALLASSAENITWWLARLVPRTIGPDKVNQLRHLQFLGDDAGIGTLMERHRASILPKFESVLRIFTDALSDVRGAHWTSPKGGYFITLTVPPGCARRVVTLAKQAGIELTPAGSTHPLREDPDDRTIRIAPTFPALPEVTLAAQAVALCVRLAAAERAERESAIPEEIVRVV